MPHVFYVVHEYMCDLTNHMYLCIFVTCTWMIRDPTDVLRSFQSCWLRLLALVGIPFSLFRLQHKKHNFPSFLIAILSTNGVVLFSYLPDCLCCAARRCFRQWQINSFRFRSLIAPETVDDCGCEGSQKRNGSQEWQAFQEIKELKGKKWQIVY